MMRSRISIPYTYVVAACAVLAATFFALPISAAGDHEALAAVFATRGDLQMLFDAETWEAEDVPQTAGLLDLEDWARQYGYKEHSELASFGPQTTADITNGFDTSRIEATSALVMNDDGDVVVDIGGDRLFPPGSATKLMTALVILEEGIPMSTEVTISSDDRIGGLSLGLPAGATVTMEDLMYAMLVGSANDATAALVRATGISASGFVTRMNAYAERIGMTDTTFSGSTGMESGATTSAKDLATLVRNSAKNAFIRKMTTTSSYAFSASGRTYRVESPNELLTDPNNGLLVLGGKNGYADGGDWSVAVRMMDVKKREPVIVVISGSPTKEVSFTDARAVAEWVWYKETPEPGSLSGVAEDLRKVLASVYEERSDLQTLFDNATWSARTSEKTAGLPDLATWAREYGYKEHDELVAFAPVLARQEEVRASLPPALIVDESALHPVLTGRAFDMSRISAEKVLILDSASRRVLFEKEANVPHPMASITKLMTATVMRDRGIPMSRSVTLLPEDEIGGARLRVDTGTSLTVGDLMYAMLVGSANNAAHALSRSAGMSYESFIAAMNAKAGTLGLSQTAFAGPSGLDLGNVSTAQDIAALAIEALKDPNVRMMASTAKKEIWTTGGTHDLTNTNGLLTDPNNGLIVMGGKTGYLHESKWNLVVHMMDSRRKPLVVVVLGSDTKNNSFSDAAVAARWAWDNHSWQ